MKTFSTKLHTVFLLVGPTGSGKSTFSKNYLVPGLHKAMRMQANIQYISSDQIRKDLLGREMHKLEDEMLYVSEQAFDMLFNRLKNVTSYPVNADFVIIDTTGLSKEFREKIAHITHENMYNVQVIAFDYKDRDEYYKHVPEGDQWLISKHIKRFKEEAMPEMPRKTFDEITKITSKNFDEYEFVVSDLEEFKSCLLPFTIPQGEEIIQYPVIGDIHGCLEELKEMVQAFGFTINVNGLMFSPISDPITEDMIRTINTRFILVGDLIDKGPDSKGIIEFIYANRQYFILVKGNHENYVYKALKGEIKAERELASEYFTSIEEFKNDINIQAKFFEIVESMVPFVKHRDFIVTHAPCERKHLGKLNKFSKKAQLTIMYPKAKDYATPEEHKEAVEKFLSFIKTEAVNNHPKHIFGHIALGRIMIMRNKYGIDTGCIYGNCLTAMVVNPEGKPFIRRIDSKQPKAAKQLLTLFDANLAEQLTLDDIDAKEAGRIKWMAENKVNFISGTMSPCDKKDEDIESLEAGLQYYKDRGVEKVVLQRKYMGSRCQMYIDLTDLEKCYAVSRNGYKIKAVDLAEVFKDLQIKLQEKYKEDKDTTIVVLDGELMPWFALGQGLIEDQYGVVKTGIETELMFLQASGFEEELAKIREDYEASSFKSDFNTLDKEEVKKKYGNVKYEIFKNLNDITSSLQPLTLHEEAFNNFKTQLELFGQDGDVSFRPFALLKTISKDGEEFPFINESSLNEHLYRFLNEDPMLIVNLDSEEAWKAAREFYEAVTTNLQMEGVVIKPEKAFNKGVAPYLKCRNKNYLTLVYGYDYQFPAKYAKLLRRKSINNKMRTSVKEYELGKRLLDVPYDKISKEDKIYTNLCIQMVAEMEKEKGLDPRL